MIREALPSDCKRLADNLRPADATELFAAGHDDPLAIIEQSITESVEAYAYEVEGELVALFGFARQGFLGIPWLLGTDQLFKHRKALVSIPKPYIDRWASEVPMLGNLVHEDNHQSIRWLKRLGFTIHPAVPVARGRFHPFSLRK